MKINEYEILVTDDCNLSCNYCFDNKLKQTRNNNEHFKIDISFIQNIIGFINNTYDKNNKEIKIRFFGGEPLLNFEFIKNFVEKVKSINVNIIYSLTTNGTLITNEMIEYFTEYMNYCRLAFSIDGKKDSHNLNRSNYDKTIENFLTVYNIYKQNGKEHKITILMTLSKSTINKFYENYKFLQFLTKNKVKVNINISDIDNEFITELDKQLNLFKNKDIEYSIDMIKNLRYSRQKNFCRNPGNQITISKNGDLYFCHRLTPKKCVENNLLLGNINIGVNNIFNNRLFNYTIKCNECEIKNICRGGCLAEHYFSSNNIENGVSNKFCILMKYFINKFNIGDNNDNNKYIR